MSRREARGSRRVTVLTGALLSVAVGAGTLAGCSSNDESEPEPQSQEQQQPDQTASPDPTPTESTPKRELPARLDKPYVQVVLDYYDAWYAALESGDTQSFMKYATGDCGSCQGMEKVIADVFANGGSIQVSKMEPILDSKRTWARSKEDTRATVFMHYREGTYKRVDRPGADPVTGPARDVLKQVSLVREGDEWLISEITSTEPKEQ